MQIIYYGNYYDENWCQLISLKANSKGEWILEISHSILRTSSMLCIIKTPRIFYVCCIAIYIYNIYTIYIECTIIHWTHYISISSLSLSLSPFLSLLSLTLSLSSLPFTHSWISVSSVFLSLSIAFSPQSIYYYCPQLEIIRVRALLFSSWKRHEKMKIN